MVALVYDNNNEIVDSVECMLSTSGNVVSIGSVGYPVDIFLEVYHIAMAIDTPFGFWRYNTDPILNKEIELGFYKYDKYFDSAYDSDTDILRFNRSMMHAVK
jgi:hypothetical protein